MKKDEGKSDIEQAIEAAQLAEIANRIEPVLDEMTRVTLRHMFTTIQKHDLTDQAAVQYCYELYSHYKLRQKFNPRRASNASQA